MLGRLCRIDPASADHPMVRLLRARGLLQQGEAEQARRVFDGAAA